MTAEKSPELTVKEPFDECKGFACPRLRAISQTREDGSKYITEGSSAYMAMVLCNNAYLGLSDGECPISPSVLEPTNT